MTGGWLKKRLGTPKVMTKDSEFMGTTVAEWEKRLFAGFGKNFTNDNIETPEATSDHPDPCKNINDEK